MERSSSIEIRASATENARVVKGGIVAGLVAGGLMVLIAVLLSLASGSDEWVVMKGASAPFLGERAVSPGFDALAVPLGLAVHFIVSIGWALGFATLAYGLSKPATMVAGAAWGVVVWVGMYYVLLPLAGLGWMLEGAPIARAALSHVFFGLFVAAAFLPFQRRRLAHAGGLLHGT
jgi:hypothetical protein